MAAQEVQFQEGADSYRYIDLLVVDPDNRIVILIERKDGTSEQNDQLTSYLDYVKGHCDSSYSIFPILMDSYNADHNASAKGYVQLDDRWLIEAIDELLNHNELEPSIRWNLSTLCNYVFSEYWDGNREPYYQGTNDKFNQFAGENAKLLRNLFQVPCKHEGTGDSSVTVGEADYQDLLWTLMSQSDVAQGLEPASIHCHARYYDTLWELSEYSGLTPIAEKITSHWDDMYAHVYFYGNAPILEATCKYGWEQRGGYSPEGDIYWPFYIIVAAKDEQEDESAGTRERMETGGRRYLLSVGASRSCPKELQPLAQKFAEQVNDEQWLDGFRSFNDKDWIKRRTKRTEEVTNFSLDPQTVIYRAIEEFRRYVHSSVNRA